MKAGRSVSVLAATAVLALAATAGQERAVTDDLGNVFPLSASPPARIVSLAPNITEILFALGLGDRVVGVTRFCDFPGDVHRLRKVGGLVDPNIEIIRSLEPDLVIGFRGNPLRVLARLRELALRVFILDSPTDIDSLLPFIQKIGLVAGAEGPAAGLIGSLRARMERVERSLEGARTRPRVFVVLYGQGLWTCGAGSYLDNLLTKAGAANVAARIPKKWFLYSRERLVRDNPDAIIILAGSDEDFDKGKRWLLEESSYRGVAAVGKGRIHLVDENAASRFGPRLVDVLENLARLLHPERFEDVP